MYAIRSYYVMFAVRAPRPPDKRKTDFAAGAYRRCSRGVANQPMTIRELADRTGRDVGTIQRTLTGKTVDRGLRPVQ